MDKILRIGLLALAWGMVLVQVANGEPYGETKTLEDWKVPTYTSENFKQYGMHDISDKIPGAETRSDWFLVEKKLVGVYSIKTNEKQLDYMVSMVPEIGKEYRITLVDLDGNGLFTQDMDGEVDFPDWVMKSYKKSLISYAVYSNKDSKKYHKRYCPKLNSEGLIKFNSSKEVRDSGGEPCEECKP
jgi:hypothetical protein